MDIGEVARRSGQRASALRYYEERGLIRASSRTGLRRQFADDVLDRLAFIALGQLAGLSLDEIAQMLGPEGRMNVDRALLRERAESLDRQIRQLTAMRDGLRHAADCRAESHLMCPTFQRLIRGVKRRAAASRPKQSGRTRKVRRG